MRSLNYIKQAFSTLQPQRGLVCEDTEGVDTTAAWPALDPLCWSRHTFQEHCFKPVSLLVMTEQLNKNRGCNFLTNQGWAPGVGSRDGQVVEAGSREAPRSVCGCWGGLEGMGGWDLSPLCSRLGQGFKHDFLTGGPWGPRPMAAMTGKLPPEEIWREGAGLCRLGARPGPYIQTPSPCSWHGPPVTETHHPRVAAELQSSLAWPFNGAVRW